MRHPLGQWQYKSHQRWVWRHDIQRDCLYRATGRAFAQYNRVHDIDRLTRSNQRWYTFHLIIHQYDKSHTRLCTISRTSNTQALTRTWLSKLNCGFIGTASMLSYREYWLHDECPLCNQSRETNIHILQCAHPPHHQKLQIFVNDLNTWLKKSNCEPRLACEIIRVTTLWMDPNNAQPLTSTCPPHSAPDIDRMASPSLW